MTDQSDVRPLSREDASAALAVVNAAASRYRGRIPPAADTVPYLSRDEFEAELGEMTWYGVDLGGLAGVVGVQERGDVTLVRHLYVRPDVQRRGIGSRLLEAALSWAHADTVLVGTWAAADWAVAFYRSRGFELLGTDEALLRTYWDVPDHQVAASVVLRLER